MNEIRVARSEFATYLLSSALAVSIVMKGSTVEAGKPAPLFLLPPQSEFALSADGQRFLINKIVKDAPPITILLNWKPKP